MRALPVRGSAERAWLPAEGVRRNWVALLAVAGFSLAGLGAPTLAGAQTTAAAALEAGREAYLEAEFEGAVERFDEARNQPDATTADLGQAHLYLATLHSMLGDETRAAQHARAAVALDPDAAVPEGAPEEVETLLADAREANGDAPATLTLDVPDALSVGTAGQLSATLAPAGLPFVSTLRLRCEGPGEPVESEESPPSVRLELTPEAGELRCRGVALTEAGAELVGAQQSWSFGADEGEGDNTLLFGLLAGGGALVVVASIIVIAVVVGSDSQDQAQLGPPSVEGW